MTAAAALRPIAGDDAGAGVAPPLALALADALTALTVTLGDLAYDLGSEPETLRRHMASLQAIDRITQTQLAIAEVLRSDLPVAARLAGVTLETLSHDLTAACQAYDRRNVSINLD